MASPLALFLLAQAAAPPASGAPPAWHPPPSVCGRCVLEEQGSAATARSWFSPSTGLAIGATSGFGAGVAFGRQDVAGQGHSPGSLFRGAKPLYAWGAVGGLAIAKILTHGREEPPLVTAPWRHLDPPGALDRVVRNATGGRLPRKARRVLDSFSYLTLGHLAAQPIGLASSGPGRPDKAQDALIPLEAAAVSLLATGQVKHLVHRPRPFAYYCEPLEAGALEKTDAQLSFFSGHASASFALAAATSAVASRRRLPNAATIRLLSYSLAGTTSLLRVLADQHYATDVLAGAAVGWLTGRTLARWHAGAARTGPKTEASAPIAFSLPVGRAGILQARFGDGFSATLRVVR